MSACMPLSPPNQLCGTGWRGYVCRLPIGRCWLGALLLVPHLATCSMWISDSQFWPIFCDCMAGVLQLWVMILREKYSWQIFLQESLCNFLFVSIEDPTKLGSATSVTADSWTEYNQHVEAPHSDLNVCLSDKYYLSLKILRMEAEVKLFTLNCWGLGLGISKHRDERMQDIGLFISQQDYDIVFLQVCHLCHLPIPNSSWFTRRCGRDPTSKQSKA